MKNILERGGAVLDEVARGKMLIAFDFDGTLAPIVEDRTTAAMRPSTRRLLRLASLLHPCAVVSGRPRSDLLQRLEGVRLVAIVGNHGGEAGFGPIRRSLRNLVVAWKRELEPAVRERDGLEIEDKGLSLAIHYRAAPSRAAARRAVREMTADLPGAHVIGGRAVVNVVPAGAHHKGIAVSELLARTGCRRAMYVGDDTTDEEAFRTECVAVAVRVGRTHMSAARYYVPSQEAVDDLLRALIQARRRQDGLDEDVSSLEKLVAEDA